MNLIEYLLMHAGEEAGELQKAVSKAARFGLNQFWDKEGMTNRQAIREELLDLGFVGKILQANGVIPPITDDHIQSHMRGKSSKLIKMFQLSQKLGCIDRNAELVTSYSPKEREKTQDERIESQNHEFEAMRHVTEQYRRVTLTAVVDDDYPEVRYQYEQAVDLLIRAFKANGRIPS